MKKFLVLLVLMSTLFSCTKNLEKDVEGSWKIVGFERVSFIKTVSSFQTRVLITRRSMNGGEANVIFMVNPNTITFSGVLNTDQYEYVVLDDDTTKYDPYESIHSFTNGFIVDEWEIVDDKVMMLSHISLENNLFYEANYKLKDNRLEISFKTDVFQATEATSYWDDVWMLLERE